MVLNIILTILIIYIFFSLLILPIQFRLLEAIKKEEEKNNLNEKTQGEMFGAMNAGGSQLAMNLQRNPLFFLANLLAVVMYRSKYRRK